MPAPDQDPTRASHDDLLQRFASRWRSGGGPPVEQFLVEQQLPANDPQLLRDLVRIERDARQASPLPLTFPEIARRFAPHADRLRSLFGGDEETQSLATPTPAQDSLSQTRPRRERPPVTLPYLEEYGLELYERIGEGGMGVVWRGRDVRLEQPRAVKVIRLHPLTRTSAHDRFLREAQACARLDHPAVVKVHHVGEKDDILFICMEFVAGGTLRNRLDQGRLEVRQAVELVRDLARGIEHAHAARVLHRDLKPANILLTPEGRVKISDFGLAKLTDLSEDLTNTGAIMGTPAYMAPEQARGATRLIGEVTDVWSLGVILYECLGGGCPFKGDTREDTLRKVQSQVADPLRKSRQEVPAALEAICRDCLEKDPLRRLPSARMLAERLDAWLEGSPDPHPRPRPRAGLWLQAAMLLVALLVAVAGLSVGLSGHGGPRVGSTATVAAPILEARSPPEAARTEVTAADLKPEEWNSMLRFKPRLLQWPGGEDSSFHQDESGRVVMTSDNDALIAMGECRALPFRLRMTCKQSPWVGDIGIFYGLREGRNDEGVAETTYRAVRLERVAMDADFRFMLFWIETRVPREGKHLRHTNTLLQSDFIVLESAGATLELQFDQKGLAGVNFNGLPAPGFPIGRVLRPPGSERNDGAFGIDVRHSGAVVREFEFFPPPAVR